MDIPDSLCPEEYSHLIPRDAETLLELHELGRGPNRLSGKYFYLGYTAGQGIAVSIERFCGDTFESHCDLSAEQIEAIQERISTLSFVVTRDGIGFDGSTGILRVRFPHLHFVELRWNCFRHDSWSGIFELIEHVEKLMPARAPSPDVSLYLE